MFILIMLIVAWSAVAQTSRSVADGVYTQGKKLEDLVGMKNGASASTTLTLPDSVKHWVGGGLPTQVQATYQEIAQGKPYGEISGGK